MTRRLARAGFAALAAVSFATACAQGTPSAPATTPTKTAVELLGDAAAKTKGQGFKYVASYGTVVSSDGAVDGTGQNSQSHLTLTVAEVGVTVKIDALVVGGDIYAKLDLGPLTSAIPGLAGIGGKFLHLDKTKMANANRYMPSEDSVGASAYVKGVVTAEKVSDTQFKGTIDLTKSAPSYLRPDQIAAFGEEGKKVPFTATLDAQGRIDRIVLNMPKAGQVPAADLTTTYSDFGTTVTVTKPGAAEIVEAPDLIYTFLQ